MPEFVIMPLIGLRADDSQPIARELLLKMEAELENGTVLPTSALNPAAPPPSTVTTEPSENTGEYDPLGVPDADVHVLDSIAPAGAKLVECTTESAISVDAAPNELRIMPVVYYETAFVGVPPILTQDATADAPPLAVPPAETRVTVVNGNTGVPLADVGLTLFTDFAKRRGASGTTNAQGVATIRLRELPAKIERMYLFPKANFWPGLRRDLTLDAELTISLEPLDLTFIDSLRHVYGQAEDGVGGGVRVGIVDTGIERNHPDLVVAGGQNLVTGEDPADFGDSGVGHGTHVAGIVAARGIPPTGVRGLAPDVSLYSYRVFGRGRSGASNFAIAKAVDQAVVDECDFINLSLGGGRPDPVLVEALADARATGCLPIAASGNEDRAAVSFPGSDRNALAVGAMGRIGTFPPDSVSSGFAVAPFGTDMQNFVASFSNIGPQVALIAPGVGVISTYPGGYAALDGTSMACPAVVGFGARLLSARPDLLNAPRDAARSEAVAQALLLAATPLGFGELFEGRGLPDPALLTSSVPASTISGNPPLSRISASVKAHRLQIQKLQRQSASGRAGGRRR